MSIENKWPIMVEQNDWQIDELKLDESKKMI